MHRRWGKEARTMSKKLTDAFAALSIRTKLICVFVLTILVMLLVNVFMYLNINKITVQLDEIYADNVRLNAIADALDGLQSSMTSYLNTKTTDAMEEYYKNEQNYADLIAGLQTKATGDELLLMERNIHYMSETYLTLTADTIEAKRGRNVEKYKAYYDDASQLYGYLQMYILSLNNRRFRTNTGDYEVLSDSLQYLEMVSIFIFIVLTLCTLLMVVMFTRNITKPLRKLSDAAYRVANGELDQADMVEVHSMDEIGVVTVAFNRMLQSIPAYINRLRESLEKERQMKEKELLMETHLKDAQLKYLQAQINPHFLFNSLNAGVQLAMMEDAEKTSIFLERMADFFRYNVRKTEEAATLAEEIETVDNYVYILNVRFAGDIHFEKQVAADVGDVRLPSMILQPIVENAVNHGIRNVEWEGHIWLTVTRQKDAVLISIRDNGQGMTQERILEVLERRVRQADSRTDSSGIGMDNVINRLELFFGRKDLLQISSAGPKQGTQVCIRIPAEEKNDEDGRGELCTEY